MRSPKFTSCTSFPRRLLRETPLKGGHKPRKTQALRNKPTKLRVKRVPRTIGKRNRKTTAMKQPREKPVQNGADQKAPGETAM